MAYYTKTFRKSGSRKFRLQMSNCLDCLHSTVNFTTFISTDHAESSAIDGVEIKIGDKFRLPKKVLREYLGFCCIYLYR